MRRVLDFLTIKQANRSQSLMIFGVISILYFINFQVNDIFTPNESFYAEAVREMFESGNFLDINYNYEPRYNKPPLTYWAIALSSSIFGINEFGIRLPIILMALGSVWLVYLLGKQLYGERAGIYSMMIMASSAQFIFVKQYASPEVPLTFLFTLTMYLFIKGYKQQEFKFIFWSYVALGLAVLTKGFPYIIVITGIIGLFVLIETNFKIFEIWKKIRFLKLHIGVPIILLIGLSWVIYMYLKEGDSFWLVYKRETFDRALSKANRGPQPFYYLTVIAWSIVPYSLAFYYAFIRNLKDWSRIREMSFAFSWLLTMLIIFTVSKGKLPTYMIQAHPALILILVPMLLRFNPKSRLLKGLWSFSLFFPAALLIGVTSYAVFELNLALGLYTVPLALLTLLVAGLKNKTPNLKVYIPFWSMMGFLIVFSAFLPKMEEFRPYDTIGNIIQQDERIIKETPIFLDGWLIHNIPFYANRKAIRDVEIKAINDTKEQTLALVREENQAMLTGFETLWSGYIYDFSSESQFFKFALALNDATKGDLSKFHKFYLVFRP
ncbi:hypothetical protein BFP97_09790 [Roseivirga sp. 4D4]|uniref:ArnT family glycosyltransferase n=1 Tax=Roseivirga sp. 4D4 TaxID=1889784 RepID=UPI00085344D9|nr:glycosyltransferase family 39 protein [Roseivirga sp. 4D4]OEK01788.1 hypothetical protein BFP97_09790 [Roseivirga sp. 4D4]